MNGKQLDKNGCRQFVCPNINLIEEKGKELFLKEKTIRRAKEMAIEYFKKTYRAPHYSCAIYLLPSFIYIASILEGDRRFKKDVAKVFGTTNVTILKWYQDIIETMGLVVSNKPTNKRDIEIAREGDKALQKYIHPDFDIIDKGGKILGSDAFIIAKVKDLAVKYFDRLLHINRYPPTTRSIMPALFYLVYILERDRRTQMEIATKLNVSEFNISCWYKDITNVFGMKIIYGNKRKVLKIIEENENDDPDS